MPDAPITDGFRKTLNFPTLASCTRCGAICDKDGVSVHDEWHEATS